MGMQPSMRGFRKFAAVCILGTLFFPWGACDLGNFTATSTVTLDGRTVISTLIKGALLSPLENLINEGVDQFFDRVDPEDE